MSLSCLRTVLHKKSIFKISKYHPYKVDQMMTSSKFVTTIYQEIFLQTNRTRYPRHFSFASELCCLCKGLSKSLKDILKILHQQSKEKFRTYINFGNDETQAQKSLISSQKSNRSDYKRYNGKQILKFEFVCTMNKGDCDARWSMSLFFCLHVWIIYLA